jgi:transcriptional regulator with XRE-family HTH domain
MTTLLKQQAVGTHVRRLRTERGISLRELARQTDFSASFMSQVENGQVSPSISSMEKIATALGVTMGEFFAAAAQGEGGLIVRAADRAALGSWWSSAEIEALSPMKPSQRLEPVLITLKPGGRSGKHPYPHPREEFAFVVEGKIDLTLGPQKHALEAGDAVMILPKELRLWENPNALPARVLVVSVRGGSAVDANRPEGS